MAHIMLEVPGVVRSTPAFKNPNAAGRVAQQRTCEIDPGFRAVYLLAGGRRGLLLCVEGAAEWTASGPENRGRLIA